MGVAKLNKFKTAEEDEELKEEVYKGDQAEYPVDLAVVYHGLPRGSYTN